MHKEDHLNSIQLLQDRLHQRGIFAPDGKSHDTALFIQDEHVREALDDILDTLEYLLLSTRLEDC